MKIGIYMLIGLLSSVLFADEALKEWISINCYGIEQINCTYMWGCESNTNQYILSNDDLYQFKVSGNQAVLELYMAETEVYPEERPYFGDKTILYDAFYNTLYKINLDLTNYSKTEYYEYDMNLNNGQCFLMNNNHYYIDYNINYNESKLYPLTSQDDSTNQENSISNSYSLGLGNIFTSIVLNNTLYYINASGFWSFKISENNSFELESISNVSELISNNKNIENIVLVTDKKNRIWIIDSIAGVIEYDTKTKEAKKTAEFPNIQSQDYDYDYDKVCFYINGYLYYIANNQVYSLEVSPHKTGKDWSNPSIPIENNAREPQYFYDYNLADNTLTYSESNANTRPEDIEQTIHCYYGMPTDTIQAVFSNNRFYILTKSRTHHIASLVGSHLKYEDSWRLKNWTPRIGASVVEMNNTIYVFGGKKIDSNTCYNDLYIYDCDKKSSKKLKVNDEVTARYNTTILASEVYNKLCIIGGKNASDSNALDAWVFNPDSLTWEYINDIPPHTGKVYTSYDEENNALKVCITFEETKQERVIFESIQIQNLNLEINHDKNKNEIRIQNTRGTILAQYYYNNMPENIEEIVFANNLFFILTKSGENQIARRVGSNLEYVSSWTITDWKPTKSNYIVYMNNLIYVLGKSNSNSYVYDFNTKKSEKKDPPYNVSSQKIYSSRCYNRIWIIDGSQDNDIIENPYAFFEFDANDREWIDKNNSPISILRMPSSEYNNGNIILTVTTEPRSAIEYQIEKLFSITPKPHIDNKYNRKNVSNNTTNNYTVISGSSKAYENPIDPIKDEEDTVFPDDKQEIDNPSPSTPGKQKTKQKRTSKTPKILKASSGAVVYKSCFWVSTEVFIALGVLYIVRRCRKH